MLETVLSHLKRVIKFGDTADACTSGTAETVRYSASQNALQLCDGSAWLSVVTAGKGHVAFNPGSHCLDILSSGEFLMDQHIKITEAMVTQSRIKSAMIISNAVSIIRLLLLSNSKSQMPIRFL